MAFTRWMRNRSLEDLEGSNRGRGEDLLLSPRPPSADVPPRGGRLGKGRVGRPARGTKEGGRGAQKGAVSPSSVGKGAKADRESGDLQLRPRVEKKETVERTGRRGSGKREGWVDGRPAVQPRPYERIK